MRKVLCLLVSLLCGAAFLLPAQEGNGGLPKDVFYLLPDMASGSVQFRGQPPATGKFNICAVDNTIRYIDKDGTELMVEIDDDMTRVVIGGVTFVPYDGAFLRLYPMSGDVSAAIKRNVLLLTDSKTSGYGIGLSMAEGFVEEFGGKIAADYQAGRITFTVIFSCSR